MPVKNRIMRAAFKWLRRISLAEVLEILFLSYRKVFQTFLYDKNKYRTAAERNDVALATRRRRRIL